MVNSRGLAVLLLAVAVLLTVCVRARAADLPEGVDCATIRRYVQQHGQSKALIWALENGYTLAQINAARKCLR